jgi:hypothetical protein
VLEGNYNNMQVLSDDNNCVLLPCYHQVGKSRFFTLVPKYELRCL